MGGRSDCSEPDGEYLQSVKPASRGGKPVTFDLGDDRLHDHINIQDDTRSPFCANDDALKATKRAGTHPYAMPGLKIGKNFYNLAR